MQSVKWQALLLICLIWFLIRQHEPEIKIESLHAKL